MKALGEATNALFIDETLCIGCDNCEKACAETHSGISRLKRKSGPSYRRGAYTHCMPALRAASLHEGLPAKRNQSLLHRRGIY